ncbi:MAG: cytochrome c biogenesis protein CcsA [Actinobacteria bacterium]|nr:cytochrome c biogenesis protein CcsA [Actinomycetota bacterium]
MAHTSLPVRATRLAIGPLRGWRELALYGGLLALMALDLYLIFVFAPTERVQGDVQRIFYFHVGSAWLAFVAFFVVALGSVGYLWRRTPRWDYLAVGSAEIGVIFTTLTLATGSIWGRVVWGVWWTLRTYLDNVATRRRMAAVLGIFGFVDVPIVWFSVQWWRSLHPQPTILQQGGGMPREMLVTLLVSVATFTLLYAVLLRQRFALERAADQAAALRDLLRAQAEIGG